MLLNNNSISIIIIIISSILLYNREIQWTPSLYLYNDFFPIWLCISQVQAVKYTMLLCSMLRHTHTHTYTENGIFFKWKMDLHRIQYSSIQMDACVVWFGAKSLATFLILNIYIYSQQRAHYFQIIIYAIPFPVHWSKNVYVSNKIWYINVMLLVILIFVGIC